MHAFEVTHKVNGRARIRTLWLKSLRPCDRTRGRVERLLRTQPLPWTWVPALPRMRPLTAGLLCSPSKPQYPHL